MYAILEGTHYNGGCCFDCGNAETSGLDTGDGHMEAIYFGNNRVWGSGVGNGQCSCFICRWTFRTLVHHVHSVGRRAAAFRLVCSLRDDVWELVGLLRLGGRRGEATGYGHVGD